MRLYEIPLIDALDSDARYSITQSEVRAVRWICLADDEFSCNGFSAEFIEDKTLHEKCGQFALVPFKGCNCEACWDGPQHASDCAVHNEPAYPNGPCDCGALDER